MEILAANGLVKTYSRRRVVDGVSLEVREGEIIGLLGPNGAGKSTSFKMMCGLVTPDRGSVFLHMAYLPQQSSVFSKLSVQDNLKGMMQLLGFSRKQQKLRTAELLEQFKIGHIRKSKAGKLSGGETRRLEIARCLVANPKIIMLDEPFAGIDPVTVQGVQVVIRELAESGIAVLITDHAAREILQITDRTYVVSQGRILCSGTAEQIVAHPEVRQKYLGDIDMIPNASNQPNTANPAAAAGSAATANSATGFNQTETAQAIAIAQQLIAAQQTKPAANATQTPVTSPLKTDNNIPLPNMPVKQGRRVRKVVAPFKSTDLDT